MLIAGVSSAGAVELSVSTYDPLPAEAGKLVNVWIKVENTEAIRSGEIYIEIDPKDGLELSPGEEARKRIGYLSGYGSQTLQYRLKVRDDAVEGTNVIDASVISGDVVVKRELAIEVVEKDLKGVNFDVGDINSDPLRIKPDDDNVKIDVTIMNLGDGKAEAVKTELFGLPEGVTFSQSYSGVSLLGNVNADSQAVATFHVDVDESVKPADYIAQLKLNYKYKPDESDDDFVLGEDILQLMLSIKPTPLYNVTDVSLEPAVVSAGDTNVKLKLTIQNIGEEEGESVRVRVFSKSEQPFMFDDSGDFVAPILEPGESGQATMEFDVDDDANLQIYFLDIEIKNVVGDDVVTFREKIPVTVSNPRRDDSITFVLIGAGIVVVFLLIFFGRKRLRKRGMAKTQRAGHHYEKSYLEKLAGERKKK